MLTYKEFLKLPREERLRRCNELSDHDAFMVRISEPIIGKVVGHVEVSKEEQEKARQIALEFIKKNNL